MIIDDIYNVIILYNDDNNLRLLNNNIYNIHKRIVNIIIAQTSKYYLKLEEDAKAGSNIIHSSYTDQDLQAVGGDQSQSRELYNAKSYVKWRDHIEYLINMLHTKNLQKYYPTIEILTCKIGRVNEMNLHPGCQMDLMLTYKNNYKTFRIHGKYARKQFYGQMQQKIRHYLIKHHKFKFYRDCLETYYCNNYETYLRCEKYKDNKIVINDLKRLNSNQLEKLYNKFKQARIL
jgi:hypothetical protein